MAILPTDAIKDPSPQLQAVLRWIDALVTTLDVKTLESTLTDDYTYQIIPKSMRCPILNKTEFLQYADTFLMYVVKDLKMTIHEAVEAFDKVYFHASSAASSATGYPYVNEYMMAMHVAQQPDGEYKISLTREFVDSGYSTEFFRAERKRQKEGVKPSLRSRL